MITRIPLHTNDERGKVRHFHVHMMATIAVIAAITEKKKEFSDRSDHYGNHFPAIAATTIAERELFLCDRYDRRKVVSL